LLPRMMMLGQRRSVYGSINSGKKAVTLPSYISMRRADTALGCAHKVSRPIIGLNTLALGYNCRACFENADSGLVRTPTCGFVLKTLHVGVRTKPLGKRFTSCLWVCNRTISGVPKACAVANRTYGPFSNSLLAFTPSNTIPCPEDPRTIHPVMFY